MNEKEQVCLKTELYFKERQDRGNAIAFDAWLTASPNVETTAGDELWATAHNYILEGTHSCHNPKG